MTDSIESCDNYIYAYHKNNSLYILNITTTIFKVLI